MADYTFITNNVPRDVIDAWELTAKERAEFDHLDWEGIEDGTSGAQFFRYRGQLYELGEFSTFWGMSRDSGMPSEFAGWDAYITDSFFSGMVIRYADKEMDTIIVGRFFC